MGEERRDEPQTNQRLTVAQAAARLGITEGAVRSRIKRGTLPTIKEAGTVYVVLSDGTSTTNLPPNIGGPTDVPGDQSELVESLQDQVRYLREQLDAERQARTEERRRADTVIAQLSRANEEQARTIGAIEAPQEPQEPQEPAESAEPQADRVGETPEETSEAQRPVSRPWWRRIFGG